MLALVVRLSQFYQSQELAALRELAKGPLDPFLDLSQCSQGLTMVNPEVGVGTAHCAVFDSENGAFELGLLHIVDRRCIHDTSAVLLHHVEVDLLDAPVPGPEGGADRSWMRGQDAEAVNLLTFAEVQ